MNMEVIKHIVRLIIFLIIVGLIITIGYIFGAAGLVIAFILAGFVSVYMELRALKRIVKELNIKIDKINK